MKYGDAIVTGTFADERVSFAGVTVDHKIGLVDKITGEHFLQMHYDGIFGLGFTDDEIGDNPFFKQAYAQNQLDQPVFALWLNK